MRLDYLPTLSILDLPPTFPNRSPLGDFYPLNASNMHSMQPDLLHLTLCMLINLISVPPYARKANATPSMQPPHLPTDRPTYTPPIFLSFNPLNSYTTPNHPNSAQPAYVARVYPTLFTPSISNQQTRKKNLSSYSTGRHT